MSEARIEYVPLGEIKRAERNPKEHDLGAIITSITKHGFWAPLVLDEGTGRLVAGHGRLDAVIRILKDKQPAPDGIQVRGEEWLLPVVRGLTFKDPKDAEAYIIADNRLVELGGWNDAMLAETLQDLAKAGKIEQTGFDRDALDELLQDLKAGHNQPDPDQAPALPDKPMAKTGDVWILGDHRLVCGDCHDKKVMEKALAGRRPSLVIADPPYGMDLKADWSGVRKTGRGAKFAKVKGKRYAKVRGDDRPYDPRRILEIFGACKEVFLWGADYYAERIPGRIRGAWLVWDKRKESQDAGLGSHFELAWSKHKHKREILRHDWFGMLSSGNSQEAQRRVHPTQKPTSLYRDMLRRWSSAGELVADPYAGSGSLLLACNMEDRVCAAVEISPGYVDVIVQRWQQLTHRQAVKEGK